MDKLDFTFEPLVSVIVPVYKVEQYLNRCVDSLLQQSYANLEIILIDDGSPDGCGAICDAYAEHDSRIIVIHQENCGLSAARNAGLDICKGEYIAFVDSDDWVKPNHIESFMKKATPDKIVCGGIIYTDGITHVEAYALTSLELDKKEFWSFLLNEEAKYRSKNCLGFYVWNKLWPRSVFAELRFREGRIYEDILLAVSVYKLNYSFVILPECTYYYLERMDSIVKQPGVYNFDTAIEARRELSRSFASEDKELAFRLDMLVIRYLMSCCVKIIKGVEGYQDWDKGKYIHIIEIELNAKPELKKALGNKKLFVLWLFKYYPRVYIWLLQLKLLLQGKK